VSNVWLYDLAGSRIAKTASVPAGPVVVAYGRSGRPWYVNAAGTAGRVAV